MILGAHESIAGGVYKAFQRADEHCADAMQIFVKNARGWKARPLDPDEAAAFSRAETSSRVQATMAHASYLINLAAEPGGDFYQKSLDAVVDELGRCEALGIRGLVIHPGSHPDPKAGVLLAARMVDEALARSPGKVGVWLENTAGQGSCLAWNFDELGQICDAVRTTPRLGICFDTCHAFAAGYDFRSEDGYKRSMTKLGDAIGGLSNVKAFHLNDCKKPLGCRVDRHEEIGDGHIGLSAFRYLLNDRRFAQIPGVLETPKPERYKASLERLRALG